jgi:PIN domain nuclease of toxin-antitoxin system
VNILLDSNAFLWSSAQSRRLSLAARTAISDPANELYLSIVSVWELSIKAGLKQLTLEDDLEGFVRAELSRWRVKLLPIELRHAARVRDLPNHHRDPFDRLLIAQGQVESMAIITGDRMFARYDVQVIW